MEKSVCNPPVPQPPASLSAWMIASERPALAAPEMSTFHGTLVVNSAPGGPAVWEPGPELDAALEPELDAGFEPDGLELLHPATRMTAAHATAKTLAGFAGFAGNITQRYRCHRRAW
ncbi:hypothetical protein A5634_05310 [Mycobacterium asiaticum]|uniref:Uncharacterized protein n=1 Tax=Mycobacterium asiaticum TaxID=1790 RepID=A0A1A3NQL4_MYCAS|nr:hypothetical protein A5634_05310 [Mycobacterium asiaticum]